VGDRPDLERVRPAGQSLLFALLLAWISLAPWSWWSPYPSPLPHGGRGFSWAEAVLRSARSDRPYLRPVFPRPAAARPAPGESRYHRDRMTDWATGCRRYCPRWRFPAAPDPNDPVPCPPADPHAPRSDRRAGGPVLRHPRSLSFSFFFQSPDVINHIKLFTAENRKPQILRRAATGPDLPGSRRAAIDPFCEPLHSVEIAYVVPYRQMSPAGEARCTPFRPFWLTPTACSAKV
jgi:hypothetical protein